MSNSYTLRQAQAAQELLRRRSIRTSMRLWAQACGFQPAKHHDLMIERLEALDNGTAEKRKVMFFLPPGSAKSTYSSKLFPPKFLVKPNRSILACSCSYTLAEQFGRYSRNLVKDHSSELGYELKQDSQSAGEWETTNGGLYFCAGVGAGIAGHRADLGLIDDPVGSQEDADSKLARDKQYAWYRNDFVPRLKPGAAQVLIMTRRHEEDLAGRLLAEEGEEWDVVKVPMIAGSDDPLGRSPGERLWPEWFTNEMLNDAKKNPQTFASLYQQEPSPEEGDVFKKDWLIPYTIDDLLRVQSELRIYCASDHAVSTAQDADLTCLLAGGVDADGVLWILPDVWWQRASSDQTVTAMLEMARRRHPIIWWAEKGHISKSIGPFLRKRMVEANVHVRIDEVNPARDKQTRAQAIAGRMSMGMVRFPKFATNWWPQAEHELLSFPHGKHDDFVDALAHLGRGLEFMTGNQRPAPEPERRHFQKSDLTFKWLKESDERRRRAERLSRLDN